MNKQPTQAELVNKLISEISEQSHKFALDEPVCYPFVAGFLESVLKTLPESETNYEYLKTCLKRPD